MKITNKEGLPQPMVDAVSSRVPKYGKYSSTTLIKSPRQYWLYYRHFNEIEEDASGRIWSIFGTACHTILEKYESENTLVEEELEYAIPNSDIKITGIADLYEDGVLSDWKTLSVWKVMNGDFQDFEKQLNTYAFMFRKMGFPVKELRVVGLMKDWTRGQKKAKGSDYPNHPVASIKINLWDEQQQQDYIESRASYLHGFFNTEDSELPECTPEEKWQKPSVWAVKKAGGKRAIKKCYSESEANELLFVKGPGHEIEFRPGENTRCEGFCSVAAFCNQHKRECGEN